MPLWRARPVADQKGRPEQARSRLIGPHQREIGAGHAFTEPARFAAAAAYSAYRSFGTFPPCLGLAPSEVKLGLCSVESKGELDVILHLALGFAHPDQPPDTCRAEEGDTRPDQPVRDGAVLGLHVDQAYGVRTVRSSGRFGRVG